MEQENSVGEMFKQGGVWETEKMKSEGRNVNQRTGSMNKPHGSLLSCNPTKNYERYIAGKYIGWGDNDAPSSKGYYRKSLTAYRKYV